MIRRLRNAWLVISLVWIAYALWHAAYYWSRWGQLISPENRLSTFATTAYEILLFPVIGGLILLFMHLISRAFTPQRRD
jgi:hypothetical protein